MTDTTQACPARCKISNLCYATAYFEAKPGKGQRCEPETCKWKQGKPEPKKDDTK